MPDKIFFSQLFGWVISFELKGSCVCPVDAGKREKAAGRGFLVSYPSGGSEVVTVPMNPVQSH